MYSTRVFWKKRPMNRKFDQCVSQKDVTSVMSWRVVVTSDTSGLYDYPFISIISVLMITSGPFLSLDSSVGRASAGLWAARSWVWILPLPVIPEVTLGSHSSSSLTVPWCTIGSGPGLEIQSWLWGSLHASESRLWAMMDPPWLWNPWAESTEVRNREHQWLRRNGDLSPQNLKKKKNACWRT